MDLALKYLMLPFFFWLFSSFYNSQDFEDLALVTYDPVVTHVLLALKDAVDWWAPTTLSVTNLEN